MRLQEVRLHLYGATEMGHGREHLPARDERHGQVVVDPGAAGLALQGLAVLEDRFIEIAAGCEREAEVVARLGITRTELDRLAIVDDRLVGLPATGERQREVVVGLRITGFELQGRAGEAFGLVGCIARDQQAREIVVGHPARRVAPDGRAVERLRVRVQVALLPGQRGEDREDGQGHALTRATSRHRRDSGSC